MTRCSSRAVVSQPPPGLAGAMIRSRERSPGRATVPAHPLRASAGRASAPPSTLLRVSVIVSPPFDPGVATDATPPR